MNPEDRNQEEQQPKTTTQERPQERPQEPESITKIADLQRMNIDQLTLFARNIGLQTCFIYLAS